MSQYLFPVSKTQKILPKYLDIGLKNIKSCATGEHNGFIYFGITVENENKLYIKKIDSKTRKLSDICVLDEEIEYIKNNPSLLIDENHIYYVRNYLPYSDGFTVCCVSLSDNSVSEYKSEHTIYQSGSETSSRDQIVKICWVNDNTIVIPHFYGLTFFDTDTHVFTKKPLASWSRTYISVGTNTIMCHHGDCRGYDNDCPIIYHIGDINFKYDAIDLPSKKEDNDIQLSIYTNGIYYIAQTNYLHLYSESRNIVEKSINIPWQPNSITYSNGRIFATQWGEGKEDVLYIYDIYKETYSTIRLHWKIPNINVRIYDNSLIQNSLIQPLSYMNTLYIPYKSLGVIDFNETQKYKFGSKIK